MAADNGLKDQTIRAAKERAKPYKLSDSGGLVLVVKPNGSKLWRLRYTFGVNEKGQQKENMLALGHYPEVSLKRAREKRDEARQLLDKGIDPNAQRKATRNATGGTFKAVAEEYLASERKADASTLATARRRLELYVFPKIGSTPVGAVTAPDLLAALRAIEKRGAHETAHRTRSLCGRIFRYAIATGRAERDVAADLVGALGAVAKRNFAAITDKAQFAELLRKIDHYHGQPVTRLALQLLALTFVRPGELRLATWNEFTLDGESPQWVIPAARMKGRRDHVVPLSKQAVAALNALRPLAPRELTFPSLRPTRPLSENTLAFALRGLGYDGSTHVPHGFRSTASTLLHEKGYGHDVIETQLAHKRPGVAGKYNRSHLLDQRRTMMQEWADYLDELMLVE